MYRSILALDRVLDADQIDAEFMLQRVVALIRLRKIGDMVVVARRVAFARGRLLVYLNISETITTVQFYGASFVSRVLKLRPIRARATIGAVSSP